MTHGDIERAGIDTFTGHGGQAQATEFDAGDDGWRGTGGSERAEGLCLQLTREERLLA
jgi:hypothetical protein